MQIERCKVCGGTVDLLGHNYIRCDYCGQIYDISGKALLADQVYKDAVRKQEEGTIVGNEEARMLLEGISGYKDSDIRAIHSYTNVENIKIAAEEKRLEEERQHQIQLEEQRRKEEKQKKIWTIACAAGFVVALSVIIAVIVTVRRNNALSEQYEYAVSLYEREKYVEAEEAFDQIKNYENSSEYLRQIRDILDEYQSSYESAVAKYNVGAYSDAILVFMDNVNYLDSAEYIDKCVDALLEEADGLIASGDYDGARNVIEFIPEISSKYQVGRSKLSEIEEIIISNKYAAAVEYYNNGQMDEAQQLFMAVANYQDAGDYLDLIGEAFYNQAVETYNQRDYVSSVNILNKIDEENEWKRYMDSQNLLNNMRESYTAEIKTAAVTILHEKGYDEFKDYVNGIVIERLFSSSDASSLIKEYQPTQLMNLDTYAERGDIHVGTGEFKDNLGNTYDYGMRCDYSLGYSYPGYLEYKVTEYSYLSGYLILNYSRRSTGLQGYMRVYGDDNVIYTSPAITKGFDPQYVNINIENIDVIRIEFSGTSGFELGVENLSFVEPVLMK